MSHITGSFQFDLCKPINYAEDGDTKKSSFLQLNEPTGPHSRSMRRLSAMINRVIISIGEKRAAKDAEKVTQVNKSFVDTSDEEHALDADAKADMLVFAFASEDDLDFTDNFVEEFHKAIIKPANKSLCYVNGDQIFREAHWEQMHFEDQTNLAIKYAAFFGLGLLGDMNKK